ncbi:MAG: hypothetical protein Greene041679_37 [Parcubacteria group bacterium Greene0416_79]|nr:MAG: hypothetical protein Greene041679_37 [Parcubacteria group bacterium Greene0416_79]
MSHVLTIPQKLLRRGELVIVPRADYEEALQLKKRLLGEEKDTDEAIHIFEKEHAAGTLYKTTSFSSILVRTQARAKAGRQ